MAPFSPGDLGHVTEHNLVAGAVTLVSRFCSSLTGVGATTQLRSAIAACGIGGVLQFPAGASFILGGSKDYENLLTPLEGQRWVGNGCKLSVSGGFAGHSIIRINANGVSISGFTFECSDVVDAIAVKVMDCDSATIAGNSFVNPVSGGVHGKGGVTRLSVTHNRFAGRGYGVLMDDVASESSQSSGWDISNNHFDGNGLVGDGIQLNRPTTSAADVSISNNVVMNYAKKLSGEKVENAGFGIGLANCQRVVVTGNVVRDCKRNGIHIEDGVSFATIAGNTVTGCSHAGIEVQAGYMTDCHTVAITGNTVSGCCAAPSGGLGQAGIEVNARLSPDVAGSSSNVLVCGNVAIDNTSKPGASVSGGTNVTTSNILD